MSHASLLCAIHADPKDADSVSSALDHQMEPFNENGEWFKKGSRWDWFQIGGRYSGKLMGRDLLTVSEINEEAMKAWRKTALAENYDGVVKEANETKMTTEMMNMFYGLDPTKISKEDYVKSKMTESWFPTFFAFLHERNWHEGECLGWFGTSKKEGKAGKPKVIKDKKSKSSLTTWNDKGEGWSEKFFDRFIKPLDKDMLLVVVDYHV